MDATIIDAPCSAKNAEKACVPEMHQTRKGNVWCFGVKCHVDIDAGSGLVHTIMVTPANKHDITETVNSIREDDAVVYGDSGYLDVQKRLKIKQNKYFSNIDFRITRRPKGLPKVSDNAIDCLSPAFPCLIKDDKKRKNVMELVSQKMRKLAPEMDPLRLGTGWKPEDLSKPQILIESTFGDSHPGSGHLDQLVTAARKGIVEAGGYGARYFCTDICDGESQGTDGINYSLANREMIANMIEIHANATPFDGGVYISSCDKGMPANLMGLARVNIPSIVMTGGTNCLLHLPAIAHEFGLTIDGDTFDRLHRGAHYLLDVRPAGRWPAEFFYYAGGVPAIMEEIRDVLHLDVLTVTGKTLGENLDTLKAEGFYAHCEAWLQAANKKYGLALTREDIIRPYNHAIGTDGSIAILKGNLVPEGAVIKHTVCPKEMFKAILRARPFDSEEECLDAILHHKVEKGDAVFIRYEGPKGSGMPEMFYTSEAISSDKDLGRAIALITDGRFSGASTGPVIGHCSPEAQSGGPIALVEEGDLIEIDVPGRVMAIVGVKGERKTPEEISAILAERKTHWKPKARKYKTGVLRLFSDHAASPMKGAYLDFNSTQD